MRDAPQATQHRFLSPGVDVRLAEMPVPARYNKGCAPRKERVGGTDLYLGACFEPRQGSMFPVQPATLRAQPGTREARARSQPR
jgi:hypothetical protein